MNDISVNIEHLILNVEGMQPDIGHRLAQETRAALQQLIEQQGLPPELTGGDVAESIAPDINRPLRVSEELTGSELALAIYQALGGMR